MHFLSRGHLRLVLRRRTCEAAPRGVRPQDTTMTHRLALILLVLAAWLSCAPPQPFPEPFDTAPAGLTSPCGPCGGAVDLAHILAICPASQPLWTAELACLRGPCQGACAGWLAQYDACVASGVPTCSWTDWLTCDACITTPDALGGCRDEVTACGADRTGCVTRSEERRVGKE